MHKNTTPSKQVRIPLPADCPGLCTYTHTHKRRPLLACTPKMATGNRRRKTLLLLTLMAFCAILSNYYFSPHTDATATAIAGPKPMALQSPALNHTSTRRDSVRTTVVSQSRDLVRDFDVTGGRDTTDVKVSVYPYVTGDTSNVQELTVQRCDYISTFRREQFPAVTDRWQKAEQGLSYVFSAYEDPRYVDMTRIWVVGLVRKAYFRESTTKRPHLYCQLWPRSGQRPIYAKAFPRNFKTGKSVMYTGTVYNCTFPRLLNRDDVHAITIVGHRSCKAPSCLVLVRQIPSQLSSQSPTFGVCLGGALHGNYNQSLNLLQWVEANKIFGAQTFLIYNNSGSGALKEYLEYYARRGEAQVIPWHFRPLLDEAERRVLYYKAQFALIYDCLYRHMFRAKYIAYLDLDEIIVPRGQDIANWSDMFRASSCVDKPYISVRNVFFRPDWTPDLERGPRAVSSSSPPESRFGLSFLHHTTREEVFWPHTHRSKYFVRPEFIASLEIHHARALKPYRTLHTYCYIEPEVGALHHFRTLRDLNESARAVQDLTMHRYAPDFVRRTFEVDTAVKPAL